MKKLNGIYVPGDHRNVLSNDDYQNTVKSIIKYAEQQNQVYNSFPVVCTQWSFLLLAQITTPSLKTSFSYVPDLHLSSRFVNQRVSPDDSFILHEALPLEQDHLFKNTKQTFFISSALKTEEFTGTIKDKFFIVSDFELEGESYVAMIEGKRAPIFGYMYSP